MRKFFAIILFVISSVAALICMVGAGQLATVSSKIANKDAAYASGFVVGSILFPAACGALAYFLYVRATRLFKGKTLPDDESAIIYSSDKVK